MQSKDAKDGDRESAVRATAEQSAPVGLKREPQGVAGLMLNLQRSHGNSFVQRLLKSPTLQRKPRKEGGPVFTSTSYAFDTYQITESHLDDPDIIARLNALPTPLLEDYRRRARDRAVIEYISKLIESRPPEYTPELPDGKTAFKWLDLNIVILPDYYTMEKLPKDVDSVTVFEFKKDFLYDLENGKVVDPALELTLYIKTVYGPETTSFSTSGYGVGTKKEHKEAGTTSLGFHERSHSKTVLDFIKLNKLPEFTAKSGITMEEFLNQINKFNEDFRDYRERMTQHSINVVDCVGVPASFCAGMPAQGAKP